MRIRINKGKGKKDRYTVLSKTVLEELRAYYIKYRPKEYLFNGHKKGRKLSEAAIRHLCRACRSMLWKMHESVVASPNK
jgi:integrase